MRSGTARTSHAPYLLRPGHAMLLEPTSSKLHCPGSRLDRRLGPAATHFGNRRFQTIRPVGADQVTSRHALSGYNSHGTRSNHLPLPSRLVSYSSQTDNYLEVALSTKDLTRSRWLDVAVGPYSSAHLRPWRTIRTGRPMRPHRVKCPNLKVGAAVSTAAPIYICLQTTLLVHWRILPSSCATVSR